MRPAREPRGPRRPRRRLVGFLVVVSLAAAGCGNAPPGRFAGSGGPTPGVTPTTIRVGGLAAVTGPLGNQYAPVFAGAQAYFDMVNANGGVHGREIDLVAKLDDQTDPSTDVAQARALVERYNVLAVVPVATPEFQGATYLSNQRVPTFGYNINPAQWSAGPTMFGQDGSYLDPTGIDVAGPFLAEKLGIERVAILAYAVAQSAQCADGQAKSFRQFGFHVGL
ncbi:MAG: ABC transporter substrate-binding protein, partial [Acidimicrobiales bacterium]